MPIAKAATNVQLASLANRLRLTLIRDSMSISLGLQEMAGSVRALI